MRAGALACCLLGAGAAAAGCRAGTVDLGFDPEVGDRYGYRVEIEATVSRAIEDEAPDVTELDTVLVVRQEVVELTADGARVEVEIRRDGGEASSAVALLDRAGSLQGLEVLEGLAEEAVGAAGAPPIFTGVGLDLPAGELRPGERWRVSGRDRTGTGRLERLGVVDGEDVAVVRATTTDRVREELEAGGSAVALRGEATARSRTTYDLVDGAIREALTRARGDLVAEISPPAGVEADPVTATVTYDLEVSTTRLR